MDPSQIRISADPITTAMCKFTIDRPIYPNESFYFGNKEKAQGSPLAAKLFELEGVTSVLISHDQVTVTKGGNEDWPVVGKKIGAAIREIVASEAPVVRDELKNTLPNPDVIRERVQEVLDMDINPAVAAHGGIVELIDV